MTAFTEHPIFNLPKFGGGLGLYRVESMIARLGLSDYLAATPRLAVAGTNGKGSTAKFAAEILRRTGRRTGLFTSPHLYRFNERIEIDGTAASDEILYRATDLVMTVIRQYEILNSGEAVGAFEAFFLLALMVFARQGVDALVLEAGIGGRFDPVRVARAPLATVTSVDFDHCDLLGNTLLEIASNKVEVAATGGTVLLGPSLKPLQQRLRTHANLLGITAVSLDEAVEIEFEGPEAGLSMTFDDVQVGGIRLSTAGDYQVENFAIAGLLAKRLLEAAAVFKKGSFATAVRAAALETYWPGRLERVRNDPPVTIDVGHSPKAIELALAAFLELNDPAQCLLVVGCSRDKDARGMVAALAPSFPRILCTSAYHKGVPATQIAAFAQAANPTARIEAVEPIGAAAGRALEICRAEQRAAYVAGGLFLSIEFAASLNGQDASVLHFF